MINRGRIKGLYKKEGEIDGGEGERGMEEIPE